MMSDGALKLVSPSTRHWPPTTTSDRSDPSGPVVPIPIWPPDSGSGPLTPRSTITLADQQQQQQAHGNANAGGEVFIATSTGTSTGGSKERSGIATPVTSSPSPLPPPSQPIYSSNPRAQTDQIVYVRSLFITAATAAAAAAATTTTTVVGAWQW